MNRPSLMKCYLQFAEIISKRSVCKRCGTGAIITSIDLHRIFSIGYNGPPHNVPHNMCTGKEGTCGCIHGEVNALLKKNTNEKSVMFLTTSPCENCAKYILQSNIEKIYFINYYRDIEPLKLLTNNNIKCICWHVNSDVKIINN